MMPPDNQSISQIARETGLSEATLFKWEKQARAKGTAFPSGEQETKRWSTQDKFLIVMETAPLSEIEGTEYCRSKGLYVEQILAWKDACMQANGGVAQEASRLKKEFKKLEQESRRKEAALAETAALLFHKKKQMRFGGTAGTPDQCLASRYYY